MHPCLQDRPLSPTVRSALVEACAQVAKRLAFDAALRQRYLRGLGPAPTFLPCPRCGAAVEQGRFVLYTYCSSACAVEAARDEG